MIILLSVRICGLLLGRYLLALEVGDNENQAVLTIQVNVARVGRLFCICHLFFNVYVILT